MIYKIGKLTNYKGLDRQVDWAGFLEQCLHLLQFYGEKLYVKQDLRMAAPGIELCTEEQDPDRYIVRA